MAVVFLFLAALFFVLGALSATGRLPRNGLAGMRTRATMASDAAWIAAHRASAWSVGVAGLICVAAAATSVGRDSGDQHTVASAACVFLLVVVIIGGVQADVVARRTARK